MHKSLFVVFVFAIGSFVPAQIGGSGKLGPFVPDRDTVLNTAWNNGVFEFTEIGIPAGVTVTLVGPNPALLFSKGEVSVAGSLIADGAGGSTLGGGGAGPGGWAGGAVAATGSGPGGGPGCRGHGSGAGHRQTVGVGACGKPGGPAYGSDDPLDIRGGSGGGGAVLHGGGGGAGTVVVIADGKISVTGAISASGGPGVNSPSTNSGGGSGGVVALRSLRGVHIAKTGRVLAVAVSATNTRLEQRGSDGFVRLDSYSGTPLVEGSVAPSPSVMTLPDLAQLGTATLGGRLKMRVVSIPGEQVVLALAGRGANIPMGLMGTLKIDPSTMLIVGTGKTGNLTHDPRIEFTFQVPNNNQLLGLPLFWQAMVNVSFRSNQPTLTNVFITSIR